MGNEKGFTDKALELIEDMYIVGIEYRSLLEKVKFVREGSIQLLLKNFINYMEKELPEHELVVDCLAPEIYSPEFRVEVRVIGVDTYSTQYLELDSKGVMVDINWNKVWELCNKFTEESGVLVELNPDYRTNLDALGWDSSQEKNCVLSVSHSLSVEKFKQREDV